MLKSKSVRSREPQSVWRGFEKTFKPCDSLPNSLLVGLRSLLLFVVFGFMLPFQWAFSRPIQNATGNKDGVTVTGQVVDDQGKPISGALVRTKYVNDQQQARTDTDGRYELRGCKIAPGKIVVSAPGKALEMKAVDVESGMSPVDFKMEQGGRVRVRVIDQGGQPVPHARLFFQRWRDDYAYFAFEGVRHQSDKDGVWEWNEAPQDEFFADIVNPKGMGLSLQRLCAGEDEFVFKVFPLLQIIGNVIDSETKEPIEEFQVIPGIRGPENMNWVPSQTLDARNGAFKLEQRQNYPAWLVKVQALGYQPIESREIRSDEGKVELLFEMNQLDFNGLGFRVITPDGKPAARAEVALGIEGAQIDVLDGKFEVHSTYAQRFKVNGAGRLEIPAQQGTYQLVVIHEAGFAQVIVNPDQADDSIRLTQWSKVEGVFKVAGKPVAGASLILESLDVGGNGPARIHVHGKTVTDQKGRYEFDRVTPDKGRVYREIKMSVEGGAEEVLSTAVIHTQFKPGETSVLNFGETGVAVTARLLPPAEFSGKVKWRMALVTLRPTPALGDTIQPYYWASVDADGSFRIDDVQSGNYSMSVDFMENPIGNFKGKPVTVDPATANEQNQIVNEIDLGEIRLNQ